jgi:iron(II)-dependent oxidoreductase
MPLRLLARKQNGWRKGKSAVKQRPTAPEPYEPAKPVTLEEDPLKRHMQSERYGFVVRQRHRWGDHPLIEPAFQAAVEAIDERFAIVPEGFVSLAQSTIDYPGCPEVDVETGPFLLARHCVMNQQYQYFVDSGGYDDLELWPEDIWPHLIDFKDQTDCHGPRYWQAGRHHKLLADHPVVGICYYEAAAYAHWAGYRLPAGAEWQMAASWRIRSSAHVLRRYPWGDALDTSRCNIWASNIGKTVPVTEYESGAAPNGVLQLIGNVWEWTSSDYNVTDETGRQVVGDMLMKEIRGGAFDTYFAAQAAGCFRTGLASLARMHNVGFRCVVDLGETEDPAKARRST